MEDLSVKVETMVVIREGGAVKGKIIAEKRDYYLLRPGSEDTPASDISNETEKVQAVCKLFWNI